MYICICKGITDSQIRGAIKNGATSIQQIRNELGLGTQCCKCISEAREIIQKTSSLE